MTRRLDITRDVCPMTTVKVGMALAKLAHGGELEVLLKKEALTKVVSSLKADGHRIAAAERREEIFVLHVAKGGGGAGRSEDGDNSCRKRLIPARVAPALLSPRLHRVPAARAGSGALRR